MKRLLLLIMLPMLMVRLASCSKGNSDMSIFKNSNDSIANETLNEITNAIQMKDSFKIVDMFSDAIQNESDLLESSSRLIEFVQGDIVSFSSNGGIGADYESENGKKRKCIQSSFSINTTENTYYIAIKECVKDSFDNNNVGVISIYIINSNNWTTDSVYRGDGKWLHGINVIESSEG